MMGRSLQSGMAAAGTEKERNTRTCTHNQRSGVEFGTGPMTAFGFPSTLIGSRGPAQPMGEARAAALRRRRPRRLAMHRLTVGRTAACRLDAAAIARGIGGGKPVSVSLWRAAVTYAIVLFRNSSDEMAAPPARSFSYSRRTQTRSNDCIHQFKDDLRSIGRRCTINLVSVSGCL